MEAFFRAVLRFRWLVITLVLGSTVLAALPIQTLRFEGDVEANFPDDDPILGYNKMVEVRFGVRDLIMIGVLNDNPDENGVFNPRTLGIVKEFSEKIALLPGIKAVRDEDVASIATMDNITGTVDGMNVDPFMEAVPDAADALADLKHALFANSMFVNWVVSQDGTGLLIMAKMEPQDTVQKSATTRVAIYNTIREMIEAKKATGVPEEFHIAGRGALEANFEGEGQRDMATFLPLVVIVIVGTLYCTYWSLRSVLLPLAVVVVSVIWTLGLMAALDVPMFFTSSMMPVVLMAIGVADGIHILSRYYDELLEHPGISSSDAVLVTMQEMWKPVVLTSLTTAAGFLSFLTGANWSLRSVLLPLAVVVVSVIWTLGLMAALDVPMFFTSSMMPVVLMAIGVADGIHILSRYYDELLEHPGISSSDAVLVTMQEMWQPVVLTSLTTAAGFLSFLTGAMVPIRDFGVFSGVGILAAMIFSLTFLPAMLSLLSPTVSRRLRKQVKQGEDAAASGWAASFLSRLGRGVARRPLAVWVPTALVVGLCLFGAQRIVTDATVIGMFSPSHVLRIGDTVLRDKFQGTVPIYVAIEGHEPDRLKDPVLLDQLDRLQAAVEQDPNVGGSLSLAEYIKRMNRVMNEDRPEMEVLPTSRDLVAQYLLLYSFSGDPDDFDEIVDYDYQHANLAVYLRSDSTRDVGRVVGIIRDFAVREFGHSGDTDAAAYDPLGVRFGRWLAGIDPTIIGWETNSGFRIGIAGNGYVLNRMSELVISGQLSSLVTSLGAVFLLTAFMFRSWVAGLINVIPISLVMIFSFGLLGLLNIPLEVGKSLAASMVIGIGIDYTIHFLSKYQIKVRDGLTDPAQITAATMATSGKAIFFSAVVVIGGFLVFLTSNFRPNFFLGAMLSLNMGACLIVSMTVLPAILNTFKPRFVYGEETASRT